MGWSGAAAVLLASVVSLPLAACSSSSGGAEGDISVVASTNVYGDIVERLAGKLAGEKVDITSIISDPAIDPHEYEASTRNQLEVSRADLILENGGGYDGFMDNLRDAAGADAEVINAVDLSGGPQSDSLNEHVWYDFPTVAKVAQRISRFLIDRDPAHTKTYRTKAAAFADQLRGLLADEARIKRRAAGTGVAITEPVPLYLLTACGLVDRTPVQFSRAVVDGTDVAPRILQDTVQLIEERRVKLLVYNAQTAGPETDALRSAAAHNLTPSIGVTETLPAGKSYLTWMHGYLSAIADALGVELT